MWKNRNTNVCDIFRITKKNGFSPTCCIFVDHKDQKFLHSLNERLSFLFRETNLMETIFGKYSNKYFFMSAILTASLILLVCNGVAYGNGLTATTGKGLLTGRTVVPKVTSHHTPPLGPPISKQTFSLTTTFSENLQAKLKS